MLQDVKKRLAMKEWVVNDCYTDSIIAYHSQRQDIIFYITIMSDIPSALNPPLDNIPNAQIHTLVLCPKGVSSANLNQKHKKRIQFWFWDLTNGNIFPSPPNIHREDVLWLIREILSDTEENTINKIPSNISHTQSNTNTTNFKDYIFSYLIIAINIIIFMIMSLSGGSQNPNVLIFFGAKVNHLINEGQVWRLFTSAFIHIGIIHLFFNLYALWILGRLCEQLFGKFRFIAVYFISGIGGSFLSYLLSPAISAGASGAIFGILGSLLIFSLNKPKLWRSGLTGNLMAVIIANFIFGAIQPGIDNYAHLGGLIIGIFLGITFFGFNNFLILHKFTSLVYEFFNRSRRN